MNKIRKMFEYKTLLKFLMYFLRINGLLTVKFDGELHNWRFLCSKKTSIIAVSILNLIHLTWLVKSILYLYSEFHLYKDMRSFDKVFGVVIDIFYIILALF